MKLQSEILGEEHGDTLNEMKKLAEIDVLELKLIVSGG